MTQVLPHVADNNHKPTKVHCLSVNPACALVVTGSEDGEARVWDIAPRRQQPERERRQRVVSGSGASSTSAMFHGRHVDGPPARSFSRIPRYPDGYKTDTSCIVSPRKRWTHAFPELFPRK